MLGPDYEFKIFRADAHFEFLTNVAVFTKDKLEVSIRAEHESFLGRKELFYLTTHSTHFIYGYMASDIW